MPGEVERFRSYAAECLRLARATSDQSGKTRLLQMAEAWRKLAEDASREESVVREELSNPLIKTVFFRRDGL